MYHRFAVSFAVVALLAAPAAAGDSGSAAGPRLAQAGSDTGTGGASGTPEPGVNDATTPAPEPPTLNDLATLPEPVRKLHDELVAIARSGDIGKLKTLFDAQKAPPVISLEGDVADAAAYWKQQSGDGEGREVLAVLLEILEGGFVHVDVGTPQEMYVWPYFARRRLDKLSPSEMVELLKIVTWTDVKDMLDDYGGAYVYFRLGIGPDGSWQFFVVGE